MLISVYTLHRHRDLWEAPTEFRPERFSKVGFDALPACAYLPFGYGERACLGSAFALMELAITSALVTRTWRIELADSELPRPEPLLTLRAAGPLRMRLCPRPSRTVSARDTVAAPEL